jgi:hypothetical protein
MQSCAVPKAWGPLWSTFVAAAAQVTPDRIQSSMAMVEGRKHLQYSVYSDGATVAVHRHLAWVSEGLEGLSHEPSR